jgi:glycosyltransferase involved in cell wall biosynthesis
VPKEVSIVVITYNAVDDLKECLRSLEKQEYKQIEVLVVNDASTDDTLEFLQRFNGPSATSISVITNKANLGVAGARNVGIQHATGEIIAFIDADCIADYTWVSELVKGYFYEGVVAVGGGILDKGVTNIWELCDKGHDFVAVKEGYVTYIQGCNMSFKSSVLRDYMFNDEIKYGYEETLLCDQLIADGLKIYFRPQAAVYHKHRSTVTSSLRRKYLMGVSSIWYRKKQKKLFMFKRHIVLFISLLMASCSAIEYYFLYFSLFLFLVFSSSLLRDEFIFNKKSLKEIIITFPFLIFIEFFHFGGSLVGLFEFRVLKRSILN